MMKFSTLATIALLAITAQALPSFHDEEIDAVVPEMDFEEVPPPLGKKAVALVQGSGTSPDGSKKGGEGEPCKAECDDCKPLCEAVCDPKALSFLQAMGDGGDDDGPPAACKKCIDENKDKCGDCLACHMAEHAKEAGGKGGKGGSGASPDGSKKAPDGSKKAPVAVAALTQAAALGGTMSSKEHPAYPPCTKASLTAGGQSGSMFQCSGPGPRGGHINYEITVPTHCTSASKCGVIINTHGQTMTAGDQEAVTGVRAAALSGKKFIVINPEDADSAWEFKAVGQNDDAQLVGDFIFEKALPVFEDIVDRNRIHAMGYSAGAITSYLLLCKYSQHVCSVAGVAFNPQLEMTYGPPGGLPTCFNTNLGGTGPTHKRSISIHAGTTDHYFQGHAKNSLPHAVSMVKSLYGISSDGEKLSKGAGVDWTRYTKGQLTLEAAAYDFISPGEDMPGIPRGGHCVPKKGVAVPPKNLCACGKDSAGDVSAYSWGVEALKFLEANPCN